ncbi:DUF805 domain-containing protein [Acinetobacter sp. ANC 3813]|uniref:DUF805 domain-containing protein n=1 Tax=Acinetobacter sp. ANC 3813 TaxID=1977873 RepID=UPI000A339B69|nr:DUF805 domain-containing protein [Acinetobacter sp. ANC 3813]OTG86856.1 DUF805 domain-containing protein [Acinetobacter sp. ANC 3813]
MNNYSNDSALSAAGRFGRFSYLAWNCLIAIVAMLIGVGLAAMFPNLLINMETGNFGSGALIFGILYLAVLYFTFIFAIRRLHDRNHSGWLSLLFLVPLANILIGLYLVFAPGDAQSNSYGAPRPTAGWESVLAWIYIILIILAIVGGGFAAISLNQ